MARKKQFFGKKNINDLNIKKNCGAWSCLKREREPSNLGTNTDQGYVSNPKLDWTVQIHKCKYMMSIPYICHFFYTGRIFENQILHPKRRLKAPKTLKMSLKKSNICIFFHSIWKNLPGACDKYEV